MFIDQELGFGAWGKGSIEPMVYSEKVGSRIIKDTLTAKWQSSAGWLGIISNITTLSSRCQGCWCAGLKGFDPRQPEWWLSRPWAWNIPWEFRGSRGQSGSWGKSKVESQSMFKQKGNSPVPRDWGQFLMPLSCRAGVNALGVEVGFSQSPGNWSTQSIGQIPKQSWSYGNPPASPRELQSGPPNSQEEARVVAGYQTGRMGSNAVWTKTQT